LPAGRGGDEGGPIRQKAVKAYMQLNKARRGKTAVNLQIGRTRATKKNERDSAKLSNVLKGIPWRGAKYKGEKGSEDRRVKPNETRKPWKKWKKVVGRVEMCFEGG